MAFYLWFFACQSEPTLNTGVIGTSTPEARTQELEPPSVAQAETPSTEAVQRMICLTDQASLQTGQGRCSRLCLEPSALKMVLRLRSISVFGTQTDEGLVLTACGTTGARILQIENKMAHVQLEGIVGAVGRTPF